MISRFLRLFRQFRDLEASRLQTETLSASLGEEIRAHNSTQEDLESAQASLLLEQTRRVSAEAIASERQIEIDRLTAALRDMRDDYRAMASERIKSVDALNLKLMEARVQEQPPDMSKYQAVKRQEQIGTLVNNIRRKHSEIDMEIFRQGMNGFPKRPSVTMNQTVGVVPTLADIEKTDLSAPIEPPKNEAA